MKEDVIKRLESFGVATEPEDDWPLDFVIQKVTDFIRNYCNISEIPEGLRCVAVDRVAGEFLLAKKAAGQLTGFDLETVVKQIQEGDTAVTFGVEGSQTPEQRLDTLIGYLLKAGDGQFAAFRRFAW